MKHLIFIFLISACFQSKALAQDTCNKYLSETPFGEIYSWFPHDSEYSTQLPRLVIKDQCAIGHCHLYSWISELESRSGIDLSNAYIDAMNIYQSALTALKNDETSLNPGAFSVESRDTIYKFGLVPFEAWTGKTNFISGNIYSKLVAGLEAILTNTNHELNNVESLDVKSEIKAEAEKSIFDFINQMAGPIVNEFTYKGNKYTPLKFANTYFQELKLPVVDIDIVRDRDNVEVVNPDSLTFPRVKIETTWARAENLMRAIIDSGSPIYLSYTHEKQFVDTTSGIMSITAFNYPPKAKLVDRSIIGKYYKWSGSHAVLIVGYQVDPITGEVIKWKIHNSWGESSGDKGYYHMYSDYLRMYGWGFNFVDDGRIDIRKQLNF